MGPALAAQTATSPQTTPFIPQPILPGGQILPLFPPGSAFLNPSIEVHVVDPGINTGTAVVLAPGGGHNTLNVGSEGADFVPFFYNYGVNTIILRNRLRRDGYNPQTDEVYDAQQPIRMVRAHAASRRKRHGMSRPT